MTNLFKISNIFTAQEEEVMLCQEYIYLALIVIEELLSKGINCEQKYATPILLEEEGSCLILPTITLSNEGFQLRKFFTKGKDSYQTELVSPSFVLEETLRNRWMSDYMKTKIDLNQKYVSYFEIVKKIEEIRMHEMHHCNQLANEQMLLAKELEKKINQSQNKVLKSIIKEFSYRNFKQLNYLTLLYPHATRKLERLYQLERLLTAYSKKSGILTKSMTPEEFMATMQTRNSEKQNEENERFLSYQITRTLSNKTNPNSILGLEEPLLPGTPRILLR